MIVCDESVWKLICALFSEPYKEISFYTRSNSQSSSSEIFLNCFMIVCGCSQPIRFKFAITNPRDNPSMSVMPYWHMLTLLNNQLLLYKRHFH
jgi:hypothetical protein